MKRGKSIGAVKVNYMLKKEGLLVCDSCTCSPKGRQVSWKGQRRGGGSLPDPFLDAFIACGRPEGKKWGYYSTKTLK